MKRTTIIPQFVELMPREIQDGVLYISQKYSTASHNCCCGCGMKVVTPLSPARWQLHCEGNLVTLFPSIGNWNFSCRSHYWIKRNRVVWAGAMTNWEIRLVKERDEQDVVRYLAHKNARKSMQTAVQSKSVTASAISRLQKVRIWLKKWWR